MANFNSVDAPDFTPTQMVLLDNFQNLFANEFSNMFAFMHERVLARVGYFTLPRDWDKVLHFVNCFQFLERFEGVTDDVINKVAIVFAEFMGIVQSGPEWYTADCFAPIQSAPLESDLLLQEHLQNH